MNLVLNVAVGTITFTLDGTNVGPDSADDMTNRAIQFIKAICSPEDLTAAAREPVFPDLGGDDD